MKEDEGHGSLAAELGETLGRLQAHLRRELGELGVSFAQARTLATLRREGDQRLTDLATLEQVTQPTMSALVTRMELGGLVSRNSRSDDGRTVVVCITKAGERTLDAFVEQRGDLLASRLGQLTDSERTSLSAALPPLEHLVQLLEKRERVAVRS